MGAAAGAAAPHVKLPPPPEPRSDAGVPAVAASTVKGVQRVARGCCCALLVLGAATGASRAAARAAAAASSS